MIRARILWGAGAAATVTLSAALLFSSLRPTSEPKRAIVKRDVARITDLEVELILNRVREGDLHALRKDLPSARRAWSEARRLGEGLWPIHEGLGDSHARANLFEEAIEEYRTAEELAPVSGRRAILLKRAEAAAGLGRSLESLRSFLDADDPLRLENKIVEQALRLSDAGTRIVADRAALDPRLHHVVWAIHTRLDRRSEAVEALARYVIADDHGKVEVHRSVIEGLRAEKKVDLAVAVCRSWARLVPESADPYRTMGDLLREAGREEEAAVAYSSIVDLRPADAESHRTLGEYFREMNRPGEAISQVEHAIRLRPDDELSWMALGSIYAASGKDDKSEEVLTGAVKRFGLQGNVRAGLLQIQRDRISKLRAQGKTEEVKEVRRRLGALDLEEGLFDLKIVMTWDSSSDVDLEVYEPGGERVEHSHPRSKAGGHYHEDVTTGRGPETYTIPKVAPGIYQIGAHIHGSNRSKVKFLVILHEDTDREERREETFVLETPNQQKFIRDIVIPR